MSINPVNSPVGGGPVQQPINAQNANRGVGSVNAQEQQSAQAAQVQLEADQFVQSAGDTDTAQYQTDINRVNQMRNDLTRNVAAFRTMVESLINGQINVANGLDLPEVSFEIPEAIQQMAQREISPEGDWGVDAVSDRILEFAQALTGGNPAMAELMRNAFEEGFAAAERAWGGELPEISQQTRERVLEGFRAWEDAANMRPEAAGE